MGVKNKLLFSNMSIQARLILVFIFTSIIAFAVNIYTNSYTNRIVSTIDKVYISNSNLNNLSQALMGMQNNILEYLNTKSSNSLEKYYKYEQEYRIYLEQLNDRVTDRTDMLMEKNIKNMSEEYFESANQTVQGKRARNTQMYKERFEATSRLYHYINNCIYGLNNEQFKSNSNHFESLMLALRYLKSISSVIHLVVALCNILLIIIMTKSITNPLKELAKAANEVAAGNFNIELFHLEKEDEVGVVSRAFNQMIANIRVYIEKIKKSMEFESRTKENELLMMNHIKDAQLKYLQAQINPHFLFNSLNAAAQLSMLENGERTFIFIEKMADFFRYNLRKMDTDTTLTDEIDMIENYIYIMNVRFAGEIHYHKSICCDIEGIRVPGMILQPIIENAVNYGIRDLEREGNIYLEIFKEEENVHICIRDNGHGMESEKILEILAGRYEERGENSNGIGLKNVIRRLELYYNEQDVFHMSSVGKGEGTMISICIPAGRIGG